MDGEEVVCPFIRGLYVRVCRRSREQDAVLITHGVTAAGQRALRGVWLGNQESTAAWKRWLQDLVRRSLPPPRLVTCEGSPGLLRAVGETCPPVGLPRRVQHRIGTSSRLRPRPSAVELQPRGAVWLPDS